jgi:hypothetical protein
MAYQELEIGTVVNDGTGDTLPVAGDKINDNFLEIYTLIGDGTSLTSGISATATVVTLTAPTISGVVGGTQTSATITTLTGTTFNAGTLALAAGSITDSSGAISFGDENLTTTGVVTAASLDISGNVDVDGTLETDALTIDGVTLAETIADTVGAMVSSNTETNIAVTYDDADNTLDFVIGTLNQSTSGNAATATALETARTIHGVSFDGTANIDLSEVVQDTVGAMFSSNTETNITATYQDADGTIDLVIGTLNQDTTGNAATATALETARTIGGTSFDGTANIAVALATLATTVTITDNESTNESNALIFTAGGDVDGGNLGLESDGTLTYNPSTGKVTATGFVGTLTGNVTGNTSGTAATVTGAAQTNITSVGTLTALQVDNININGNAITSTAGTDLTITPVAGQQIVLDGAIVIDAGVVTGATSITSTAFVGDITGDVTGNADTATTLATARTIGGTSFDGSANIAVALATLATTVTITDNESTNESNALIFTAGGDVDGGNLGLESDGTLTYNPSTGKVTATGFVGALTGAVTGAVTGNADTATTLATARTIGGTSFDGSANIAVALATLATTATVSDSTANTNFPVVFNNESNALLDDTGALRYNPSTGTLLVPNLVVAGTTTTVDTVTMEAANAIIFEGATADAHETTLTIVDPTADRTINLPNQSGTIPVLAAASNTAITSTPAELNKLDGATVVVGEINALDLGSTGVGTAIASKAVVLDSSKDYTGIRNLTISGEIDAATGDYSGAVDIAGATTTAAITASGIIKTDDTTAATSTTDGSLQTDGGLSVAADAVIGDDLFMLSDAAVITFGADKDVTLTHVADTGLLLNGTSVIQFNDASQSIGAPSNAILDINATDEIELNATLIDVNGNLDVSGTGVIAGALTSAAFTASGVMKTDDTTAATSTTDGSLQTDGGLSVALDAVIGDDLILLSDAAVIHFGADSDVTLTHVADTGLLLNGTSVIQFNDASQNIGAPSATVLDINATDEIELNATLVDVNANLDVSGTYTGAGTMTTGGNIIIPNAGNIGSVGDTDSIAIASNGVVTFSQIPVMPANSIDSDEYIDGSIDRAHLSADIIDGTKIADDAIDSEHYTDGSIDTAHIADNQITLAKMAGLARGKIIVGDASGDPSALAAGTNGQVLASDGTDLSFVDISASALAADNLTAGDAAVLLTTSSGNITLDAAANDSDIIFKGTDGGADTLFLTIDGSDAGSATFGDKIIVGDGKLVLNSTAVTSTAAELNALDGITAVVGELNALDIGSTAVGTAVASKAVILDSNKDYTGIRNLTISGEIDAATGDFSGVVDVAGATTTAAITASGIIKTDDTTAATSTTDGSLQTDGGLSVAADAVIGDDLFMLSDAAVVTFGADKDVTLTHVADTGLLLNAAMVVQFRDSAINIGSPADGDLDINADDEIELNSTLIDINGNLDVSGTGVIAGALTSAAFTASGIIKTDDTTAATSTTDGSLQTDGGLSVTLDAVIGDDLFMLSDAAVVTFGVDKDVTLTHVHNTGILLNSTNVIQFNDASQNIGAPSNAILDINATDEIELNATLVDINANVEISGNLTVAGTTTQVDTVTMNAANAVVFEGATADAHETTLTIIDPTADRTQRLINQSGYIPLLAADTTTAITSTPAELNILDGATVVVGEINALDIGSTAVGTAVASKAVILDSSKDYTGIRNLTISGELDAATLDISGAIDVAGNSVLASVDVTGVATAATFEPDGDTASGDNAAIGYTSTEGLILTGQGSTGDITLKNDADAVVFYVPTGTDDILFPDNAKAMFGTGSDLVIWHNSANSYIQNSTGNINIQAKSGESSIVAVPDGAVTLYHDNAAKLATASTGVTITGEVTATGFTGTLDGVLGGGTAAAATTTTLASTTITASGIIKTDDTTAATSVTDGSLQTDGGLSVTLDAVIGDDIIMISDAAQIAFGVNSEITLAHVHNVGLTLTHVTAGDNLPVVLQLKSEEDIVVANEVIASIEFAAGDSDGTDGATVAAGIHAIAEDTFSASANATKLVFTTGVSETAASSATAKATLSSIGDFTVAGDLIIKDGGTIGSASDLDAIAIASNGVVTFSQIPVMPANSIDSDEYIDGSIDRAHLSADIIDGTKIADDAIDSEHYAADSIDEEHIANDAVGSAELKTLSTLLIKNSAGSTLKTIHGAGA